MKKITTLFVISIMLLVSCFFALPTTTYAATFAPPTTELKTTYYQLDSVKFNKDVYSKWHRLNDVFTARRASETAIYLETKSIKTSSTFGLSVPLSAVSTELGFTIEKSVTSTIKGTGSAGLKKGESAAFYYREHWKEYSVKEKAVTLVNGKATSIVYTTKYIQIPQKLTTSDYGWFYSLSATALTKNLSSSLCDDNYSCKVK